MAKQEHLMAQSPMTQKPKVQKSEAQKPTAQHPVHRFGRTLMLWFISALTTLTALGAQAAGLLTPIGQASSLDMLTHNVEVDIQDGFVITRVQQTFANPSPTPLDAHYRFPLPSDASVGQFTYWVAGQPIHGEVIEKAKANEIYQAEKQQGRKVAVSEQQGFQHFDIRVASVQPGEDVRLELVYIQAIEMDHGIGRYVYPLEDGGTDEVQKAFWTTQETVKGTFSFNARLRSSQPVDAVRVADGGLLQQQTQITQLDSQQWTIAFTPENQSVALNKDVVFYWRLQTGVPGGLDVIAHKPAGQSRGTFMMTLTPADDLQPIQQGTDWTLVLDISGSMRGKFSTLIEGVRRGLAKFNPADRVRVILFNGEAKDFTGGYVTATPQNMLALAEQLQTVQPDGSTNLMDAVKMALTDIEADRTSAIWLVTDGVANVGETKQKRFLDVLKTKDIRLFTFIMGNGANKPLLNGLSKASNGFAIEVSNSDDMLGQLKKAASKVSHQAMHDIDVTFKGLKVSDVEPQVIGSLYRGQQLHLFGHYWRAGKGEVIVTAKVSGKKIEYRVPVTLPEVATDYPELERMRAFAQIKTLLDEQESFGEDADRKDAVIDLAKEASLVTPYTSMIVLEEEQFARYGIKRSNATRIAQEEAARQKRGSAEVKNHNQAAAHPTLSQPRSNLSGGAFDIWWVFGFLVLVVSRRKLSALMS